MKRAAVVVLVALLVGCGSTASNPSSTEKTRRAVILGPALLGTTPNLGAVDQVKCDVDQDKGFKMGKVDGTRKTMGEAAVISTIVAVDLIACPQSKWGKIAPAYAEVGLASEAAIREVVDRGIAALN